jgi:hypothetical protein
MQELVRQIAAHPQELAAVEWRDLERLLFEVFDALGYRADLTRPAKDIIDRFTEIGGANRVEGLLLSSSGFTNEVVKGRPQGL